MMEEFNLMLSTLLKRLNTYFIFACMCLNIHRFCLVVTFCGIIHYQTEYVLHVCKFVFQGSRIINFQMVVCESKVSQKEYFLHASYAAESGTLYLSFSVCMPKL